MPRRDAKKEAAPDSSSTRFLSKKSESAKGGKKRNIRDRESMTNGDGSSEEQVLDSEWHACICAKEWEVLHELLQELKDGRKNNNKRGKSPGSGRSSRSSSRRSDSKSPSTSKQKSLSWLWKGSGSFSEKAKSKADPVLDKKSLLSTDAYGRTPLFCALNDMTIPDLIILELLHAQPEAVSVADQKNNRLPLHLVARRKKMDLMAELLEIYPQATRHKDAHGKTPLAYAMDLAKRQTDLDDSPPTFWATEPEESSGKRWQEGQIKLWEMTRWLLLASASHRETHLSMDNGQPLLIEALLHAAPPTVIALLIAASATLLKSGDQGTSYCCSAMYLCIFRQYPLFVLRKLGTFCPDDVRFVRDETGLGLVSAHYVTSCFEKSRLMEYVAAEEFMAIIEQCIVDGHLVSDNPLVLEWWAKLKYLIFFTAGKDADFTSEDHLLHAALVNTDTPPNVIRLLLALYPDSACRVDPNSAHPLHLYSMHREYIPRNYESPYMHGLNVMDMLLSLDEGAVFQSFKGRLALHHAIASGRAWSTLQPLVSSYRSSLRVPDPVTNFYPAMLAASYEEFPAAEKLRLLQLTRNQYSSIVWRGLSDKQQKAAIAKMKHFESLKRLDTVFELLRRYPRCVETAIVSDENDEEFAYQSEFGTSVIASHYLSWCYKKVDGGSWVLFQERMDVLKMNIRMATERGVVSNRSKEFLNWLRMLKLHIWQCPSVTASPESEDDMTAIPRDDDFLLHAAVSEADTPPDIAQLLVGLFPGSAFLSLPHSQSLPLHLACKAPSYIPRHFEVAGRRTVLDLLIRASPEAVFMRSGDGRLALHHAIDAGKTINDFRPLIIQGPAAISVPDPCTGLYPFQLMALSRAVSSEDFFRFQTIARNKDGEGWDHLSREEQGKRIKSVQDEHQLAVLSSIFELLRLDASVLNPPPPTDPPGKKQKEIVLEKAVYEKSLASYHERRKEYYRPRKKKSNLRSFLSDITSDSTAGDRVRSDASAFSSIDMVSTISNVSSHLSFRARKRAANSHHKYVKENNDEQSESEDSDIYSEEMSFVGEEDGNHGLDEKNEEITNNVSGEDGDCSKLAPNALEYQRPVVAKPDLEYSSSGIAETSYYDENSKKPGVPREILDQNNDDVSLLDDATLKSSRGVHIRPAALPSDDLIVDSRASRGRKSVVDNLGSKADLSGITEDPLQESLLRLEPETERRGYLQNENNFASHESPPATLDDSMKVSDLSLGPFLQTRNEPRGVVAGSNKQDGMADDGSIQEELVHENEASELQPAKEKEEEEPVVYFRLRRSACRNPGGMMLRPKKRTAKRTGVTHNDSSIEMDFLSILNASLPEGGMDYLSTLEASSGSLPTVYDGLAPGTSGTTFDRMQRIKEIPSESQHGTKNVAAIVHEETTFKGAESSIDGTDLSRYSARRNGSAETYSDGEVAQHNQSKREDNNETKAGSLVPFAGNGQERSDVLDGRLNGQVRKAPAGSLPSTSEAADLIQWRRISSDRKVKIASRPPTTNRGENIIQWRRHIQQPRASLGPIVRETGLIEWRRNKDGHKRPPGSTPNSAKNSKASQSVLSALETRRKSLEISARTSNYVGVKPRKLKACLQCGLSERAVLMLPCTHLCLCRQCAEDFDKINSCAICMGPVVDTMVVL